MSFLEDAVERALGPKEQSYIDQAWVAETGLDSLVLMETAANAIYREILSIPGIEKLYILLGSGNNSGDGWALARLLANAGYPVELLELYPQRKLSPDCQAMREAALKLGLKSRSWTEFRAELEAQGRVDLNLKSSLFVDAIYGSGFKISRPLDADFQSLKDFLTKARAKGARVLAIDCPSGLDSSSGLADPLSLQADYTLSFIAPKLALVSEEGSEYAGEIILADLGMPEAWWLSKLREVRTESQCYYTSPSLAAGLLPRPSERIHKGSSKKLMLTGGAPTMAGALLLAARAALAGGSAYTYLCTEASLLVEVLDLYPEFLLRPFDPHDKAGRESCLEQITVHLIGPGAGEMLTADYLESFIAGAEELVLDADALNLIAREEQLKQALMKRKSPAVLCPHPGEFRRLFPELADLPSWQAAAKAAEELKSVIILKGHRTVIALADGRVIFNQSGNKALAKAGSGDSLAGLVAALIARNLSPAEAAVLGVYAHGRAADLAVAEQHWLGLRIPEIISDYLDPVFRELEEVSIC